MSEERIDEILDGLYDHTIDGEKEPVVELTNEGLSLGMEPLSILFDGLIPALEEVGRLFEDGEFFVPGMLVAAQAMQGSMKILRPLIAETDAKPVGKFVMGTVKGDIHDIGKNLCNVMLEGAGFEVFDLGVNVTLGLPFIRTSPDHGTALNIAGTGTASENSLCAAIKMAGEMAQRQQEISS